MKTLPNRIIIYPKDVSNITGVSTKSARKLLSNIRKKLGKPTGCFITIQEFSQHTGIREEELKPFLT